MSIQLKSLEMAKKCTASKKKEIEGGGKRRKRRRGWGGLEDCLFLSSWTVKEPQKRFFMMPAMTMCYILEEAEMGAA